MGAVAHNPARKQAFIRMMRDVVSDIIKGEIGIAPTWPNEPQPAPEHERAGRG